MPSGVENNRETNCGEDTRFNQEKIGEVQGENLPEQRALFETTKKNLTDDQENVWSIHFNNC